MRLKSASDDQSQRTARHLFLARSSWQLLLVSAMAQKQLQIDGSFSRLIFMPTMADSDLFERVLDAWRNESAFDQIVVLRRQHCGSLLPGSAGLRQALRRELAAVDPLSVTVFNDREESGQTLLAAAARKFPAAWRRCVEDGAQAYTRFRYRPHSWWTRMRGRMRVGSAWSDVCVLGTHPLNQEYLALHPHLLRPELRGTRVHQLDADQLGLAPIVRLARTFSRFTGFDPDNIPAGATLLALSHSSYARRNPDYVRRVRECAQAVSRAGSALFYKSHPRETEAHVYGLADLCDAREIPRSLPAECLFLLLRDRALAVTGGISTGLLSAALLMPLSRVSLLHQETSTGDHWDDDLLKALKIGLHV